MDIINSIILYSWKNRGPEWVRISIKSHGKERMVQRSLLWSSQPFRAVSLACETHPLALCPVFLPSFHCCPQASQTHLSSALRSCDATEGTGRGRLSWSLLDFLTPLLPAACPTCTEATLLTLDVVKESAAFIAGPSKEDRQLMLKRPNLRDPF